MIAVQPQSKANRYIASCFGGACQSYDDAARLQRVTGHKLFEDNKQRLFGNVLDLGCGTGNNSVLLNESAGWVAGLDLSLPMAKTAQMKNPDGLCCVQGDAMQLPFQADSFDGVYSNLMLQWIDDLSLPLAQIERVLKPGGYLCFSTLLEGTLRQLQQAWAQIDDDNHINRFKTEQALRTTLAQSGFEFELSLDTVVLDYRDVTHLARELKHLGANHVKGRQNKGLTGPRKWARLNSHYDDNGRGGIDAGYEVAYVVARRTKR